jgi:serine/threonine protein kinase
VQPEPEQAPDIGPWQTERLLADRYRVKACLRQSGSCHLHRVQDVFRDTSHLALRPSPKVLSREGGHEWFEHYCRNALSVRRHPNVLTCERMTHDGDMPFLIMEDVEGDWWDTAVSDGQLVELSRMLDVAWQVAEGLAWLHSQGQIHYNVKPANVLICNSGLVKVLKYGEVEARTRAFASPEQMAGEHPLTQATDVWSWAVSVLHMFVGRAAWPSGQKAPIALRRYMQSGSAKPGIALMPGTLAELLAKCFKSDPDERVIDMAEIAEAVKEIHASAASEAELPAEAFSAAGEGSSKRGASRRFDRHPDEKQRGGRRGRRSK